MPFVVSDDAASVRVHVARPNPIWRVAPCEALLIVPVTDTYMSPAWYPSKAEHGKVVPTWNYEVVHVAGQLVAHDDVAWVVQQIRDLTSPTRAALGARRGRSTMRPPTTSSKLQRGDRRHRDGRRPLTGKRKLSQNSRDADQCRRHRRPRPHRSRGGRPAFAGRCMAE